MTEKPIPVPVGRELICCVLGARRADSVYPGRLGCRDATLQILVFTSLAPRPDCVGLLHVNVPTGPLALPAANTPLQADLRFLHLMCRSTGLALRPADSYLDLSRLNRLVFLAQLEEVPGSYGRHVPILETTRAFNGAASVNWSAVYEEAFNRGFPVAGGADFNGLKCASEQPFDAFVGDVTRFQQVTREDLISWACNRPLLLVDVVRRQIFMSPSGGESNVRPMAGLYSGGPKHHLAAWVDTLLALMLSARRPLPPTDATLYADDPLDPATYRKRLQEIRRQLGFAADHFLPKAPAGRRSQLRVGKLKSQAVYVVRADRELLALIERCAPLTAVRTTRHPRGGGAA